MWKNVPAVVYVYHLKLLGGPYHQIICFIFDGLKNPQERTLIHENDRADNFGYRDDDPVHSFKSCGNSLRQ